MAPALAHPLDIQLPLSFTPTHELNDIYRTRKRSSTFTAITNWALAVQPGTPAPISPAKRRRRVSNSSSPSFLLDPTTPKSDINLTAWGYTSVFVSLPVTPKTPSAFRPVVEASGKLDKGLKKIKSMGILRRNPAIGDGTDSSVPSLPLPRTRSRSRSGSISVAKPSLKHVKSKSVQSATIPTKSKAKKNHPPLPLALQNEIMLMQYTGGGSLEVNAQRFLEERSKMDGITGTDAVYRDENGVMWFDEDERDEYQSLIPSSPPASPWIQFTSSTPAIVADEDPTRRPSVVSLSPTECELEAAVVRPASPSAYIGFGVGLITPSTSSSSRTEHRRKRRPAPLKLYSVGFDDSFEPTSAEAAALAAGMYSHVTRVSRRDNTRDVVEFGKGRKMNLAKRAKALFGIAD